MKTLTANTPSVAELSQQFNYPAASIRSQFRKNAVHIRAVIAALESGDKRVTKYTKADLPALRDAADNYERQSVCAS